MNNEAPKLKTENPFERQIESALIHAGEIYTTDHGGSNPSRLDFYLTAHDIHIEVKTMHSERIAEQMSRVSDVVVAQGPRAIAYLADLISRRVDPPAAPSGVNYAVSGGQDAVAWQRRESERLNATAADERDKARARQLIESIFKNRGWSNDELVGAVCAALATVRAEVWRDAILIVDTAPGCHSAGKWYIDPVALVQRMNAALETSKGK